METTNKSQFKGSILAFANYKPKEGQEEALMKNNIRIGFYTEKDEKKRKYFLTIALIMFVLSGILVYTIINEQDILNQSAIDYMLIISSAGVSLSYFIRAVVFIPKKKENYVEIMDEEIILKLNKDKAHRVAFNQIKNIHIDPLNIAFNTSLGDVHIINLNDLEEEKMNLLKKRFEEIQSLN